MSSDESSIVCRQCGEVIPLDAGHCPHCGKGIRGLLWPIIGILFGIVLIVPAFFDPGELLVFAVLGLVISGSSGYLLYDRRQRIEQASERGGHTTSESDDEGLY